MLIFLPLHNAMLVLWFETCRRGILTQLHNTQGMQATQKEMQNASSSSAALLLSFLCFVHNARYNSNNSYKSAAPILHHMINPKLHSRPISCRIVWVCVLVGWLKVALRSFHWIISWYCYSDDRMLWQIASGDTFAFPKRCRDKRLSLHACSYLQFGRCFTVSQRGRFKFGTVNNDGVVPTHN